MTPRFFANPSEFRGWLEKHHHKARELWVGFYKRGSGRPSLTWPESVDTALRYGWIDGIRKRIDGRRYAIRFTPRKPGSIWSTVNVKRVRELTRLGLMHPAGIKVFQERKKTGVYSYEQRNTAKLGASFEGRLRANKRAWRFFQAQAPCTGRLLSGGSSARRGKRPGESGWPGSSKTRRAGAPSRR